MSEAPKPGLYTGTDAEHYFTWPYVNASRLKLMDRSPMHARHQVLHPPEPTKAMNLGTALHLAVLEPHRFEDEFLVAPKVDRRFKEGKRVWAEFEERAEGRTILQEHEYDNVRAMARHVIEHPIAAAILASQGHDECAVVWDDQRTGIRCKAKIDALRVVSGWPAIVDVKSTVDASREGFRRQIANLGYWVQAGLYTRGMDTLYGGNHRWAWIAVEKEEPNAVGVYEFDQDDLAWAQKRVQELLELWKVCDESNVWPGYSEELQYVTLPPWVRKSAEDIW